MKVGKILIWVDRKFGRRLLSFVNCAKVELDTGELCMIEPCLEDFDRACNNDGDGWENLDDRLGAFSHFVFEKTNKKYPIALLFNLYLFFDHFLYSSPVIFKATYLK